MTEIMQQIRRGAVAGVLALLAGTTLLLMLRADTIEYSPHRTLYAIAAVILALRDEKRLFRISLVAVELLSIGGLVLRALVPNQAYGP